MAQTDKLARQQQDSDNLDGLQTFASLPGWLVLGKDSQRVCDELLRSIPEFRTGGWELKHCDAGHVRYKSDFWTARYDLTVHRPGDPADSTLTLLGRIYPSGVLPGGKANVQGKLGADGWRARLPAINLELYAGEPETVLSALKTLADPSESRRLLEDSIRAGSTAYQDLQIKTCTPNIVRYKPGSRCTIVYHLEYDPALSQPHWPRLVVAKTYRGEKGKNAFDSMAAIWNSPLGDGSLVKVAEPLAYLPELNVLVQGPVREDRILKDVLSAAVHSGAPERMAELDGLLLKTAAGLAALHNSGVSMGRPWTWEDEYTEVQKQVDELAIVLPELKAAATPVLARLKQIAMETPPDPLVPSHGTFRPAQVLIHQDEIGFIDFDSFCQSEPANDLALFLAAAFSIALNPQASEEPPVRQPLDPATRQERFDTVMTIHDGFIQAYQHFRPVTYRRVILWEALDIFTYLLHGWTKVKIGEVEDLADQMERFLITHRIMEPR